MAILKAPKKQNYIFKEVKLKGWTSNGDLYGTMRRKFSKGTKLNGHPLEEITMMGGSSTRSHNPEYAHVSIHIDGKLEGNLNVLPDRFRVMWKLGDKEGPGAYKESVKAIQKIFSALNGKSSTIDSVGNFGGKWFGLTYPKKKIKEYIKKVKFTVSCDMKIGKKAYPINVYKEVIKSILLRALDPSPSDSDLVDKECWRLDLPKNVERQLNDDSHEYECNKVDLKEITIQ